MVKDYDLGINYHPGKANVVANALSCKPASLNAIMDSLPPKLRDEITQLNLVIVDASLANILEVAPTLEDKIRSAQEDDVLLKFHAQRMQEGKTHDFTKDQQGTLRFRGRICVPERADLRKKILAEAHKSSYSIHLGCTKMYEDLRQTFCWDGMKTDNC